MSLIRVSGLLGYFLVKNLGEATTQLDTSVPICETQQAEYCGEVQAQHSF
jgi:hypothetical protein